MARRLAQLSAELSASRAESGWPSGDAGSPAPAAGGEWWEDHTRINPARAALSVVPDVLAPTQPPPSRDPTTVRHPVPVPGRHASRRARDWSEMLPETLRGRVGLGPTQLTSVAVVIAVGLALTCWWVVRGDAREVAAGPADPQVAQALVEPPSPTAPVAPVVDPPGERGGPSAPQSAVPTGTVTVDVAGKVRRPGIAVLDPGSRVVDALEAAGGAKPGVSLTALNLARVLVDGEQIVVGAPPRAAPASPPVGGAVDPGPGGVALVNLNQATQTELETLPQVGPVTATSIIAWRELNGGFSSVEELLEVDGIGEATLAQIAPFATI